MDYFILEKRKLPSRSCGINLSAMKESITFTLDFNQRLMQEFQRPTISPVYTADG